MKCFYMQEGGFLVSHSSAIRGAWGRPERERSLRGGAGRGGEGVRVSCRERRTGAIQQQ